MSRRRRPTSVQMHGSDPGQAPEPVDRERVLARFRHLVGRSATLRFVPWGPVVEADTPEEMEERVGQWIVSETATQRPS